MRRYDIGHGDGDDVVDRCPEQVLLHLANGRLRQTNGGQDVGRVALHLDDIARFDSDVRACADGYSEVRLRKR
jgi:hypothetical protein